MTLEFPNQPAAPILKAARTNRRPPALPRPLARQVSRFDQPVRTQIRAIVREVPRAGDLLRVFPALLYALATDHGTPAQRRRALELIDQGDQLKSVARVLGVPMWLRRLPPEAFCEPIVDLPDHEAIGRRMIERLPARCSDCADWLDAVRFATRAGGIEFAHWITRQRASCYEPMAQDRLAILAAYAWFSDQPQTEAGALTWSRWQWAMSLDTALCSAKSWFNRVLLSVRLQPGTVKDTWLDAGTAGRYTFAPLITAADLIAEARQMNNCCDQYASPISNDRCRLFAVRLNGRSVATLEIGRHFRESAALSVNQLKGHRNIPVPLGVWQATYAWLAGQERLLQTPRVPAKPVRPYHTPTWGRLMAPYRQAKGGAPWFPVEADPRSIGVFEDGLHALAVDCGIRSWLIP